MATSEILGLFQSPDQYRAAQEAAMQQQFAQRANLAPLQKASILGQQAGYRLGQGIGGALGGEDQQLKMISQRQALANQLDPNNPESYMRVAQAAAQMGDQQFAIAIADAGRKAKSELALVQQRTAEKMTGEQRNSIAYADSIATRGTPEWNEAYQSKFEQLTTKAETTSNEQKNAASIADAKGFKRGTPEWNTEFQTQMNRLTTKEPKERNIAFGAEAERKAKSMYGKSYADLTPDEAGKVDKAVEVSEQTKAKAGVAPAAAQAKQIAQNKTDLAKTIEESAFSASDRIDLAQSLRNLAPKAFTGFASNAKLSATKVANAFGIPTKGGSESEIIDQILGQMTIGAAGQLKGALSDKDREFLKQTIGSRGLSVDTLLYVADEIERRALQDRNLNKRINNFVTSGGSLNDLNFETEKTKSSANVKKLYSEYRDILKKVANNTATLTEAKRAKQIRDELELNQ
jgi:hypothetical protein